MRYTSLAIRLFFSLCLTIATFNHARTILLHGFFYDYGYGARIFTASKLYWDALAILDPLAAILLFIRPKAGILMTAAIIISDVAHNTNYVAISSHGFTLFYLCQVAFLVLVLALAPLPLKSPRAPCD